MTVRPISKEIVRTKAKSLNLPCSEQEAETITGKYVHVVNKEHTTELLSYELFSLEQITSIDFMLKTFNGQCVSQADLCPVHDSLIIKPRA